MTGSSVTPPAESAPVPDTAAQPREHGALRRWTAAAGLLGLVTLLTGCGLAQHPAYPPGFDPDEYRSELRGWARIASSPLAARRDALAVSTARGVLILGGRRCSGPGDGREGWLRDGAAYDPATDRWSAIAAAPLPVTSGRSILMDDRLYVTAVDPGRRAGEQLLRYDVSDDSWTRLPPPVNGPGTFVDDGGVLVAVAATSSGKGPADLLLDPRSDRWVPLTPADPIGASSGRRLYWADGDLVLIARPDRGRSRPELARTTTIWSSRGWSAPTELPTTTTDAVLLNGAFVLPERGRTRAADGELHPDGGVLEDGRLRPLPAVSGSAIDRSGVEHDIVLDGGLLHDGVLLETGQDAYRPLPRFPGPSRRDAAAVATGTTMLVWGGATADGGKDLGDGWLLYP